MIKSLCIFCGSNAGIDPIHGRAAAALGAELGRAGIDLVYGGGKVGLMGIVADAAIAAGARATGVIPRALASREVAHAGLDALYVVGSMHERKAMMADLADGFIALSGGLGTFEELFEIWTWRQLGEHRKPVGLLNIGGFYDKLTSFIDDVAAAGFLSDDHRSMLIVDNVAERLISRMQDFPAESMTGWIGPDQR